MPSTTVPSRGFALRCAAGLDTLARSHGSILTGCVLNRLGSLTSSGAPPATRYTAPVESSSRVPSAGTGLSRANCCWLIVVGDRAATVVGDWAARVSQYCGLT